MTTHTGARRFNGEDEDSLTPITSERFAAGAQAALPRAPHGVLSNQCVASSGLRRLYLDPDAFSGIDRTA
jgi:hypothetical protein